MGYTALTRDAVVIVTIFLLVVWFWSTIMTSPDNVSLIRETEEHRRKMGHVTNDLPPNNSSSDATGCSDYRFMPPGTFPYIALASVPGSGNTWVRWLLQSSTGFPAASVYNVQHSTDFRLKKCLPCNGQALVVKNHADIKEPIDGAIIILRNPYSALIAEFNRKKSGTHAGHAPIHLFNNSGTGWRHFVNGMSKRFVSLLELYIHQNKPIHIVFYENLKKGVEWELRKMLQFLKVNINEKRLTCTLSNAEGSNHRSPNSSMTFDPFSMEQRSLIDDIISRMDVLLKDNNLPALPEEYWIYPGPFPR
ncbi:WSC domain-containing protein 1-like [Strongylocentrotus purpuratus]|uniref:Sulfotransferase n=1 Tax=Strongylocentrotus purpuratus TaxID=7668 RepID=A0A7M7PCR1_STRPU|nr:WSC domain-containing protein 1-like [Strongylocentrotus purpuratus]